MYPGGKTSVPMVLQHVHWGRCREYLAWLTGAKKLQRTWHALTFDHKARVRQETSCFWHQVSHMRTTNDSAAGHVRRWSQRQDVDATVLVI